MKGMNHDHDSHGAGRGAYGGLALHMGLHFVIMYLVMYTMIASLDHFYFNLNNVYMTLIDRKSVV